MGTIGLAKNYCGRFPLKISGYIGLVKAFVTVIFFIIFLIQKKSILNYLRDKHEQLYMSIGLVDFIGDDVGLVYVILVFLMCVDFVR